MFKKLLSYIWPITKILPSDLSGELEITWENGKKVLDSKGANYSYGPLQEVLVYGLRQMEFSKEGKCLILGMGAGSVIESLRKDFNFKGEITAVELDQKVIELAETEFGIKRNNQLKIIHGDAYDFVLQGNGLFDLVIIDLFIHLDVPEKFFEKAFWNALVKRLNPKAKILFNSGIDYRSDENLKKFHQYIVPILELEQLQPPRKPNKLWVLSHKKEF